MRDLRRGELQKSLNVKSKINLGMVFRAPGRDIDSILANYVGISISHFPYCFYQQQKVVVYSTIKSSEIPMVSVELNAKDGKINYKMVIKRIINPSHNLFIVHFPCTDSPNCLSECLFLSQSLQERIWNRLNVRKDQKGGSSSHEDHACYGPPWFKTSSDPSTQCHQNVSIKCAHAIRKRKDYDHEH